MQDRQLCIGALFHMYNNKCPVGRTMNVIGDRWTVMMVRDLLRNSARRFQDFLDEHEGLSPNTLSNRLKWLEEQGIVERHMYEERPPRAEYRLTKKGRELGPVVLAMKKWGEKHKAPVIPSS
ncbi:MAG: helix-turn-helix domain-containing protein [Pseudomonadota bacterium]